VIYYWWTGKDQIYLLYAYQKNNQTDLTQEQIRQLGKLVERSYAMNEQGFDELLNSVRWMGRHMRGEDDNGRTTRIPDPDVKAIRETTGLSQSQFALMIGVKLKTLQNWEQKRVRPAGPARALLQIVSVDPHAAIRALHGHAA